MELILQVLMMFIVINTALKLSFWSKWWYSVIFGILCAAFITGSCQWAILQSKTQLADYLTNKKILQDVAVLITIEAVLLLTSCFSSLLAEQKRKSGKWFELLRWYPGLLVFFVLFYLLTQSIYSLPGSDFKTISYVAAGIALIVVPALSQAIRYFLPEEEFRMEIHFLVSLFVCIIGLITTVNGNVAYAAADAPLNIKAIVLSVGLFLIAFLIGMFWDKLKWVIHSNKLKKNK